MKDGLASDETKVMKNGFPYAFSSPYEKLLQTLKEVAGEQGYQTNEYAQTNKIGTGLGTCFYRKTISFGHTEFYFDELGEFVGHSMWFPDEPSPEGKTNFYPKK